MSSQAVRQSVASDKAPLRMRVLVWARKRLRCVYCSGHGGRYDASGKRWSCRECGGSGTRLSVPELASLRGLIEREASAVSKCLATLVKMARERDAHPPGSVWGADAADEYAEALDEAELLVDAIKVTKNERERLRGKTRSS